MKEFKGLKTGIIIAFLAMSLLVGVALAKTYTDRKDAEEEKDKYDGMQMGDIYIVNVAEYLDRFYEVDYKIELKKPAGEKFLETLNLTVRIPVGKDMSNERILEVVKQNATAEFFNLQNSIGDTIYDPVYHELEGWYYNQGKGGWEKK
jgi:hypothetical protein